MKKLIVSTVSILLLISICNRLSAQEEKSNSSSKKNSSNQVKPDRDSRPVSNGTLEDPSGAALKQQVVDEIKAQLAKMASKQLMALVEFCKQNEIAGEFVVDLTVEGKGKVVTVMMVFTPEIPIPKKNMLKDKLAELEFDNIKIPKKQRIKYRYTLKF